MSWLDLINAASAQGYRVELDDEADGWIVITPKAFRRPSERLGTYKDEAAAWRGAAWLAHNDTE